MCRPFLLLSAVLLCLLQIGTADRRPAIEVLAQPSVPTGRCRGPHEPFQCPPPHACHTIECRFIPFVGWRWDSCETEACPTDICYTEHYGEKGANEIWIENGQNGRQKCICCPELENSISKVTCTNVAKIELDEELLCGSCQGFCGETQSASNCACDVDCIRYDDCCDDKLAICPLSGSCAGNCGQKGGTCHCDEYCGYYGDCCEDFVDKCGSCEDYCGQHTGICDCTLTDYNYIGCDYNDFCINTTETCSGNCGKYLDTCSCQPYCEKCCVDAEELCAYNRCIGNCNKIDVDGCSCNFLCEYDDYPLECCHGYRDACKCKDEHCGGFNVEQNCYCNDECEPFGDCCAGIYETCEIDPLGDL